MNAIGPTSPTPEQIERARGYATAAVMLYGEHDDQQRIRSGSNGIWNDHPAVQAALAAIADAEARPPAPAIAPAVESRDDLLLALRGLDKMWSEDFPGGPGSAAAIAHLHDTTLDVWRKIRVALGLKGARE